MKTVIVVIILSMAGSSLARDPRTTDEAGQCIQPFLTRDLLHKSNICSNQRAHARCKACVVGRSLLFFEETRRYCGIKRVTPKNAAYINEGHVKSYCKHLQKSTKPSSQVQCVKRVADQVVPPYVTRCAEKSSRIHCLTCCLTPDAACVKKTRKCGFSRREAEALCLIPPVKIPDVCQQKKFANGDVVQNQLEAFLAEGGAKSRACSKALDDSAIFTKTCEKKTTYSKCCQCCEKAKHWCASLMRSKCGLPKNENIWWCGDYDACDRFPEAKEEEEAY